MKNFKEYIEELEDAELEIGIEVEMEHTDDRKEAEKIAKDHLKEKPDYYSRLVQAGLVDEEKALELYDKYFGGCDVMIVVGESETLDIFDAENGLGQTPNNQNVDYRGFKKSMTPVEFRKLVLPGVGSEQTKNFVLQQLDQGKKLGQPTLYVKWQPNEKVWLVWGHEGRSRSDAIAEKFGPHSLMEVHIFPTDLRNKNIRENEEYQVAKFISEDDRHFWESFKDNLKLRKHVKFIDAGKYID